VLCKPLQFTPDSSKFEGERCGGVSIRKTDRGQFVPVRTGFEIALQLRRLYALEWEFDAYDRLLGNKAVLEAIRLGRTYVEFETLYHADLGEILRRRGIFLIYD